MKIVSVKIVVETTKIEVDALVKLLGKISITDMMSLGLSNEEALYVENVYSDLTQNVS